MLQLGQELTTLTLVLILVAKPPEMGGYNILSTFMHVELLIVIVHVQCACARINGMQTLQTDALQGKPAIWCPAEVCHLNFMSYVLVSLYSS